jgi:hypothetical protein
MLRLWKELVKYNVHHYGALFNGDKWRSKKRLNLKPKNWMKFKTKLASGNGYCLQPQKTLLQSSKLTLNLYRSRCFLYQPRLYQLAQQALNAVGYVGGRQIHAAQSFSQCVLMGDSSGRQQIKQEPPYANKLQ